MGDRQDEPNEVAPDAIAWIRRPGLAGLVARNAALMVCTLGLHRFWGNAAWRRHVWSRIVLRGDPLEFTGTGLEGFKGFLIGLVIFAPLFAAVDLLRAMASVRGLPASLFAGGVYVVAIVTALAVTRFFRWRYLLSRTRWRGIEAALDAPFPAYLRLHARLQALNALTLFLIAPLVSQRLRAWMLSHVRLGDARLTCAPEWRPLMGLWLCAWLAGLIASLAIATQVVAVAIRSGQDLPPPPVLVPVWVAMLAAGVALACHAAYRFAAWRGLAAALRLGEARLACRARPGFAAGRLALAALIFVSILVAVLLLAVFAALWGHSIAGEGSTTLLSVMSAAIVGGALLLTRDAFFRPGLIGHFVGRLDLSGGEALDRVAADEARRTRSGRGEVIDVGFG